jgi:hypothetical protein
MITNPTEIQNKSDLNLPHDICSGSCSYQAPFHFVRNSAFCALILRAHLLGGEWILESLPGVDAWMLVRNLQLNRVASASGAEGE